ncbi:MAG: hypothetical protein NXI08_08365 [bacterium]|nr:hypothetical protein [bacterium]
MNTPANNKADHLKKKLHQAHQLLSGRQKRTTIAISVCLIASWLLLFVLAETQLYLPPAIKIGSLLFLILLIAFLFWQKTSSTINDDFLTFYRRFSKHSKLKELGYALDLERSSNANPKLIEAAIYKNLELVEEQQFDHSLTQFISSHPSTLTFKRNSLLAVFACVVASASFFNFNEATQRYFSFTQQFEKPNPYQFTITPGSATLEQGTLFEVSIEFEGDQPDDVVLFLKTPVEETYRKRGMESFNGVFQSSSNELNSDLSYYIEMDGFKSELYEINVQLRPRFTDLTATVIPPNYSGLDSAFYSYPFSQITALQGSSLLLKGTINKAVNQFELFSSTDTIAISVNKNTFDYSQNIEQADTLSFYLIDESGLVNLNPFEFLIDPTEDAFPIAEILEPKTSVTQVEPSELELLYRTSDDFGITSTRLGYQLTRAFVDDTETGSITLSNPANGILQNYIWDVSALDLKPKDEVTFWIETSDNDAYNGFKSSRSEILSLTLPSLIDYFEELDEKENEVGSELDDVAESFEEMQQQYEQFREQLKENPQVDYQDVRQLQEVQNQQEEIRKKVDELNEKFDELKEELNENSLLSDETLEAYEELKQLMEEIDDPALREALEQLQQNMNAMTPEQLREAMQNVEFNEQLYKERIERTIELFKQLKLNADLEKLAQSYDDMARQEEQLQSEDSPNAEAQNEAMLEQIEQLKEQLNRLSENTSEKNEEMIDELQNLSRDQLEEIKKELARRLEAQRKEKAESQSSSGGDKEGDPQKGQNDEESQQGLNNQQQNKIQKQFNQLAEMTRNSMQQMNQQQMNVNIAGLQYILYSLINLSMEQEDLVSYASGAENRSQAYVGYARDQKNVENIFANLSDSLFQLSTEIPQFSNQINLEKLEVERLIEAALTQMAERNQGRASVTTRQALGGINKLSTLVANLLEQIQNQQNQGSGSGGMSSQQMMEQLQQMGENQQQLNQQIQDMINDIQGERLREDQMERLDQLSRQQNEIRKQLQELQQGGGMEGGDELGSELERMIEQMEETINDLRGGAVDPTLIERQQNILSRMLQAEDALQEREEEERREGEAANEFDRVTPPEITLEELEMQIRNRLNDPDFTKYAPDYQRLIEKYFELLKEVQQREIQ